MLSIPWDKRQPSYDYIVVGSGYGGSITAARIAAALPKKHSLCILERGKEWEPGQFPNNAASVIANVRSDLNPLGLYEFLGYQDISVIKASGLGGTSLMNANVAIVPDEGVFELAGWPRTMRHHDMQPFYDRARGVLAAGPVPKDKEILKVTALERRAAQIGTHAERLNIAVNFEFKGTPNRQGVVQNECTLCGDCVTGCNVHAKNTLPMNYLPLAKQAGADIFVQIKVTFITKLPTGGWRVNLKVYDDKGGSKDDHIDAKNVILSAGSINSTEILMRSEVNGLSVSPALGTGFSGNGDFFGLAYNGDFQTNVLGYGPRVPAPSEAAMPGPSIVGIVRYNGSQPVSERITVEDFSFPSAFVTAARSVFGAIGGEDTTAGNEDGQRARALQDLRLLEPYAPNGALNHTMLYLVMGQDNARGTMNFETPPLERDGRMRIEWDQVGQQIIFRRMNEELRRHAQALGANYIMNPTWSVFETRHLITAHPLGGCPMGEDYLHGAVDEWGRVFAGDGSVHDGLFVADGALIPSALGVNPFLTISAITERIAERKIKEIQGEAYPKPPVAVSMAGLDPLDVITRTEAELEKLFRRVETLPLEKFVNTDGPATIDIAERRIHNNAYWKGFFPKGHVLNAMSSAIFTGFKKEFHKAANGKFTGITNDTDGRITATNSLEEVTIDRKTGTLEPGKYIHLKYLEPQWSGFYDIFKMINDDLLIGRVYLGTYPNGIRLFTFPMTREYGFAQMTVDDHTALFDAGTVPTAADLQGVWEMSAISNNNHLARVSMLAFQTQPDGRLEARYQLLGLLEGLVVPSFVKDHFQLNDFTPFHDEIRKVADGLFVGRYIAPVQIDIARLLQGSNLGILHVVPGTNNFGFYYVISRTGDKALPTSRLLQPFLDTQVPDGTGLTFDETMVGWYFEGQSSPSGKANDLKIADKIPATGAPAGATEASFTVKMMVRDVNEFVDGSAHEASLKGSIRFAAFQGKANVTYTIDERTSRFNYLIVNDASGEAEMRYHLEFSAEDGTRYLLDGKKYMQKNGALVGAGANPMGAVRELLDDYTTLFCHISKRETNGTLTELGLGYLKFRTFEDLRAIGNLTAFLASFQVTGITDPLIRLRAQLRFLAFTGQFVIREYDPLALPIITNS